MTTKETLRLSVAVGLIGALIVGSGPTAFSQPPAPAQPAPVDGSDVNATPEPVRPKLGMWRAWLDSPGGELPFGLELEKDDRGAWRAWFINGEERMVVPIVSRIDRGIILAVDYYDASIVAKVNEDGTRLDGEWKKRGKGDKWPKLPFHATYGEAPRFTPLDGAKVDFDVSGRWEVKFSDGAEIAVGIFNQKPGGSVTGTFLTAGGDYRFLAGSIHGPKLRLSGFDGAHAFLFHAMKTAPSEPSEKLEGEFWSGDAYHVTWTAVRIRDAKTHLDGLSHPDSGADLSELFFKDLYGTKRVLSEDAYKGKARIIEVFGTWCPNCSDAARYLTELDKRYRERGLSIVGLAFEYTGEFARDARQVQRFAAAHGVEYPLLMGGVAEKEKVAAALPFIEGGIRAYPTTIFLHGDGRVHSIHTGFAGPAAPEDHQLMRRKYEEIIEELLAAEDVNQPASGNEVDK